MVDTKQLKGVLKGLSRDILLSVARPFWRRAWHRIDTRVAPIEARLERLEVALHRIESRVASIETRLEPLEVALHRVEGRTGSIESGLELLDRAWHRIESRVASIETRLELLDGAWQTHVPSFLNAVASVPAISYEVAAVSKRFEGAVSALSERADVAETRRKTADASIALLWKRMELIQREIPFEFEHGIERGFLPVPSRVPNTAYRIISTDKIAAMRATGHLRLNLGCGHLALPDYINVDARELPGVDVVADVGELPFDAACVEEIFSSHLIENFSLEQMRRQLLPYWRSRLCPSGVFKAVTSDAAAIVSATATGMISFNDFREIVYGAQDYSGDFHFNLFTPESLKSLLLDAGFKAITVPVSGRRNGTCFEFEIVATSS